MPNAWRSMALRMWVGRKEEEKEVEVEEEEVEIALNVFFEV